MWKKKKREAQAGWTERLLAVKREMKTNGLMIVQDDATKREPAGGEGCGQNNDKLPGASPSLVVQPRRTSLAFWTGRTDDTASLERMQ